MQGIKPVRGKVPRKIIYIIRTVMRSVISILLLAFVVLGAYGQEPDRLTRSELKKLQKEQKKEQQAAEMEALAEITDDMVTHQQFVLEADYLSDRKGSRIPVQSSINFIMVDSLTATVQLGSAMSVGYNGVGGTTVEGRISKYEYSLIGKNKDVYSISMSFMSSLGIYDVTMMVMPDSRTDATIRGNWAGSLSYHGKIVPLSKSRIYKGQPSY